MKQSGKKFLKDKTGKQDPSKIHQEYLGFNTPENYFSESKSELLSSMKQAGNEKSGFLIRLNPVYRWAIAASVAILFGSVFFLMVQKSNLVKKDELTEEIQSNTDEFESTSDELLISSLFVDDSMLDEYVDEYLMKSIFEDIVYVDPGNVIINSLLMEDSQVDQYIDDYLLDEMIF